MFQLHEDQHFSFETLRCLGLAPYGATDIREVLEILPNIKPGDFEDWYREWNALALRVLSTVEESKLGSYSASTLRNVYFRASHYFFVAKFFLHGNPEDPRSRKAFELWRQYFDKANALLPIPGEHVTIHTNHGFDVPAIFYRAAGASAANPRPTLIIGGGFDSSMGENHHFFGFAALERGYNVVVYDGPGQPSVVHQQKVGWIAEWEKVVSPIMDHIETNKERLAYIDQKKIGLVGMSLGGYLAARAAAFEPRLAAAILIDGVWEFAPVFHNRFPECNEAWEKKDEMAFNKAFDNTSSNSATSRRWAHDHTKFSFCESTAFKIMQTVETMNMEGIAEKIKMPVFVGDAEDEPFFIGQPAKVAKAIGDNAELFVFGAEQAAQAHCAAGAMVYQNQIIMDWFGRVVGDLPA